MIPEETLITVHGMPTPPVSPILVGAGVLGALGLGGYAMKKTAEAARETKTALIQGIFPLVPAGLGIFLMVTRPEKWAKITGAGLIGLSALMLLMPSIKAMSEQPGKTCALAGQRPEEAGGICCEGLRPKKKYLIFGPYVCK